jgi:hypothetical protein
MLPVMVVIGVVFFVAKARRRQRRAVRQGAEADAQRIYARASDARYYRPVRGRWGGWL